MNLEKILNSYQSAFNSKDLDSLGDMFDDNIILKDWDIEAIGKDEVLKANKKIFEDVPEIKVKSINNFYLNNIIFCELEIFVSKKEKICVFDIIETNSIGKIVKISAYKG